MHQAEQPAQRTKRQKVEASAAIADAPPKDPHLPPMHRAGDLIAPNAPQDLASAGLEEAALTDLVVKLAYTVARFTPEWVAQQLHLSLSLVRQILPKLALDGLVEEVLGVSRYKITPLGREQAGRLLE